MRSQQREHNQVAASEKERVIKVVQTKELGGDMTFGKAERYQS